MSTGNTYGATSSTFGGGVPVWRSIDPNGKWQGGGVIQNLPAAGTVIAAGHPVEIDTAAHTAKLANFFPVHTDPTTGTTLKVKVFPGCPRLKVGNFIGVPPAISGGAMTCITVGAITSVVTDGVGYDQITISGSSLGASLAVDSLLTEGIANGSTTPYAVPNALTLNDVYIETDTTVATVAGVHSGTIYAERAPYMCAGVKTALPTIKFDNSH
jgi:hypothetical protein